MSNRLLATCSFFAAAAIAVAAPLFDQPVEEVHLVSGETLHDVQAKSFNTASVLVKYREGAKTIPYDQFPPELRALVLARKPTPRVSNKPVEVAKLTETTKKPVVIDRLPGDRFKGLSLLSTGQGARADTMTAEIYNDTSDAVTIDPSSLQAELDNGKLAIGRHWVSTDGEGRINMTMKSTQEIAPKSTSSLNVSFAVPPGVAVTRVAWSQN